MSQQDWAGMDGATAYQLITRHADGWGDIRNMMHDWLGANAQPALTDAQIAAILHGGDFTGPCAFQRFARAIERRHGIGVCEAAK